MAKGIEILNESLGEGISAAKGSRIKYSVRLFLRRGEEVTPDFASISAYGDRIPTCSIDGVRLIIHSTMLGKRQSIAGIEMALVGMSKASYREVIIPPHLAYREQGAGPIPPNALLRAKIWLHEITNDP